MPFSTDRNNLLYEIYYNSSYLWYVIAHFGKIFFHMPIHYEAETKFCVSVCKSAHVHSHAQTKRLIASKFGMKILEKVFGKTSKRFFKNRSSFLKWFKKYILLDFNANCSFTSRFFSSFRGTRGLQFLNLAQRY